MTQNLTDMDSHANSKLASELDGQMNFAQVNSFDQKNLIPSEAKNSIDNEFARINNNCDSSQATPEVEEVEGKIEKWEGFVQKINEDSFTVGFKSNEDEYEAPDIIVNFYKSELSDYELRHLRIGSYIELTIKSKKVHGKPIKISTISLTNFQLNKSHLEKARQEVRELLDGL